MIVEEETEMERSRQVIDRNPKLKNERFLDGVRALPDFHVYEQLCRGEQVPRKVRSTVLTSYQLQARNFYSSRATFLT